jgi:histone H3
VVGERDTDDRSDLMKGKQKPIRRAPSNGVVDATIVTPAMKMRPQHRLRDKTLREIRKYQKSTKLLLPRAPIRRIVKQMIDNVRTTTDDLRVSPAALCALQEAAETYLVYLFADSNQVSAVARRVTLYPKDMDCAYRIGERIKQPVVVEVRGPSKRRKRKKRNAKAAEATGEPAAGHPAKRPREEDRAKRKKPRKPEEHPAEMERPRKTEPATRAAEPREDLSSDDGGTPPNTPTDARTGEASD